MKLRREIKEEAKSILKGRLGQAFIAMLIYGAILSLVTWLLSDISVFLLKLYPGKWMITIFMWLILLVVEVIIVYNLIVYFIRFKRGEARKCF